MTVYKNKLEIPSFANKHKVQVRKINEDRLLLVFMGACFVLGSLIIGAWLWLTHVL